MADLTFNDWNTVAQYYGQDVANYLQQQNVPLNQVGSYINKNAPGYTVNPGGQTAQGFVGSDGSSSMGGGSILQQLQLSNLVSGSQQPTQQQPSSDPTQNPNYPAALMGGEALRAVGLNSGNTTVVNPSPSQTPSSSQFSKSGVSSVSNPQTVDISGATNPSTPLGSVFNAVKPVRDLNRDYTVPPTAQPTGAQFSPGTPYARPPQVQAPPAASSTLPMAPAAPTGTLGANYANTTTGVTQGKGPQLNHPFAPSQGVSNAGVALAHMAGGGPVGDTDTVPAMLTPGEYVLNRDAVQRIGTGRLNQLNNGRVHMQDGGLVDMDPALTDPALIDPYIQTQIPVSQSYVAQSNQPLTNPTMPVSQSGAVQQQPIAQISNYPPAAPNATNAGAVNQPVRSALPQNPLQRAVAPVQQPQFQPQAANQVGPPTPVPNAATGVNMNPVVAPTQGQGQVGPPTPQPNAQTGVNMNPVSTFAKQASDAAINKVAAQNPNLQRLRELTQLMARGGQAASASLQQRQPIRYAENAVPSPDAFRQNSQEQLNAQRYT